MMVAESMMSISTPSSVAKMPEARNTLFHMAISAGGHAGEMGAKAGIRLPAEKTMRLASTACLPTLYGSTD
jgi:hypothetical protein